MTDPKPPSDRDEQQEQEKWYERTRYQILLFAGGIALFGLVLGLILDWYIDPQTSTQKKDLVQALGLITAGVAGAVGIYFTWRGQRLAREAQEENQKNTLAQLENAREQLRLAQRSQEENQKNTQAQLEQARNELDITRQGQITERFTRAIDQLGKTDEEGKELFEIRLGGIYALERIARESEEDHWPIMEVLTAYVRQHAPWRPEGQQGKEDAITEKPEENSGGSRGESRPTEVPAPAPDIQAIMTVLRRRTRSFGHGEPERLDLDETNLSDVDLSGADLSGARFAAAFLDGANLSGANLSGALLAATSLFEANLSGAVLNGAYLRDAVLDGAVLGGADLSDAQHLTQEQLHLAGGDKNTRLPSHLKPPAHWGVKPDEQTKGD
jgi:hypothetical protein